MNIIRKGCGKKYTDRRGENTCGQKDWWSIDLCPNCEKEFKRLSSLQKSVSKESSL